MQALLKRNRLEYCAMFLALLLSIACAARGLVYDDLLIVGLCFSVPLMWFSFSDDYKAHPFFAKLGLWVVTVFLLWSGLQWVLVTSIDISAWQSSVSRVIFVATIGFIALQVGSSVSASRLFFLSLLLLSIIMVCISFFLHRSEVSLISTYYAYEFINPNNAASYLGVMLIICISQLHSLIRQHMKGAGQSIAERIENMKLSIVIQILLVLFGCVLFLAALFLTGSRGGVIISLAVCGPLFIGLILKRRMSRGIKKRSLSLFFGSVLTALVMGWVFNQHGSGLMQDILVQGLDGDVRPELFEAVIPMIMDQPILGHGLGGFASHFQPYRSEVMPVEGLYDKAHSHYLELAAEMGLIVFGGVLLVAVIVLRQFIVAIRTRKKHYAIPSMGIAVLTLMALHSTIDFPLQIPAILALVTSVLVISVVQSDKHYILSRSNKSRKKARKRVRTV
ncbi:MAG: O-antigen ligase family protein [Rickettsiales bacterium]|nr:O-antigen ligase family protein [Rickettsiales bacterium]